MKSAVPMDEASEPRCLHICSVIHDGRLALMIIFPVTLCECNVQRLYEARSYQVPEDTERGSKTKMFHVP